MTTRAEDRLLNLEPAGAEALSRDLGEPEWAGEVRRAGLAAWASQPFPKPTDELWRRTDPARFQPEGRKVAVVSPTFETVGEGSIEGVTALTMDQALRLPGVQERFFSGNCQDLEKFSGLNAAYRSGGAYLHLPEAHVLGAPLRAIHRVPALPGPAAVFPHSLVVGGRNSQGTVIECFDSADGDLLATPVLEVQLEEGAHLQYVVVSRWGEGARALYRLRARLAKDSQLRVLFVGLGGSTTKALFTGDLEGAGARSEMLGVVFAGGRQHFEVDTQQNHLVPSSASDVLFNCALNERSRTVFLGNILVAPKAQKTDAYQKNRNLLLSRKARADSSPKLEILANDVRCTHGATFTTYDAEQQFYLQSRGLKDADARRLIVTGFFQEVIERIQGQPLVDWLSTLMQEKMEGSLGRAEA